MLFKDHIGPVTSARFNVGSTSIVSGSETGQIIVYNVVTGQGCRPMVKDNIQVSVIARNLKIYPSQVKVIYN